MALKKKSQDAPEQRTRPPRNELMSQPAVAVSFKAWFTNLLGSDRRFKEHHYEQIRLYVRGLGLSETEDPARYEEAVKRFFGG